MTYSAQIIAPTELLPDVHELDDQQKILWLLTLSKGNAGSDGLTSAQISERLADQYGIAISRQKVAAILDNERGQGTIRVVRRNGRTYFKVMRRGEDEILSRSTKLRFIEPSKALSSIRTVEDILRPLSGEIRICDAYVDGRTLDYVASIEKPLRIRLLTENIQNSSRFRRDLAAFERERAIPIEARLCSPGQLHDRYILHTEGMLLVGASLKDIGKKQSMIIALPSSLAHELERAFERRWSTAGRFQ